MIDAADSTIVIAGKKTSNGPIRQLFIGSHYKQVWETPVKVEVFNIDSARGGLKTIREGGSSQTKNLRLEAKDGKQYVLRNIDKDPSLGLPTFLRHESLINIIKAANTAENPYAPPVIAALEKYAGIFHTNPQIVFIPKDERIGEFQETFGNHLALFEERPDGDHSSDSCFGNSSDIVSTAHMLKKRYEDYDHFVDEKSYARVRLFDMLIGDWGRHEDQWRWATFEVGKNKIYKPIPRDRDHAFFKFDDGLLSMIVGSRLIRPDFQSFNKGYRNITGLNLSAQFLDRRFLNSLSKNDWINIADSLQKALSDDKINAAVKVFPAPVYIICGARIIRNLKSRRDLLPSAAKKYYLKLAMDVQIVGSDKEEMFLISMDKKNVTIEIFDMEHGELGHKLFYRTFYRNETKRIKLRGLGGNDSFRFKGSSSKINLTVIGDEGKDFFTDPSEVTSRKKNIRILNDQEDNIALPGKWRISKASESIGRFDRQGFRHKVKPNQEKSKALK